MQNNFSSQIEQLETLFLQPINLQNISQKNQQQLQQLSQSQYIKLINNVQSMQKVFINSLKLNQKLFNSIIQKEANINAETNNFMDFSSQIDTKIQDALKRTKQLYEDTVHQNQKARFLLQQFISPIRQQLRSKVDETTFTLQMKMLLDQYDTMGHQITYDNDQQKRMQQQKRKSVNSETLSFLRDHILPVISSIDIKLGQNISKTDIIETKIQEINSKNRYLEQQLNLQRQIINDIQKKTLQRINQKISDSFLEKKIRDANKIFINQFKQDMENSMKKMDRYTQNLQKNLTTQIQSLKTSISSFFSNQKAFQNYVTNQSQKQAKNIQNTVKRVEQHNVQLGIISKKLENNQNKKLMTIMQKKLQSLTKKIEDGQFKVKDELKSQQLQNFIKKLKDFDSQVKRIKAFQKKSDQKYFSQKGELQGIRDILSKKANFSDILLHIQNKVDKQQFKQFKQKFYQDQKIQKSSNRTPSFVVKQADLNDSRKRKNHLRSKSFFSPSSAEKFGQTEEESQQNKRFQLGFNSQLPIMHDIAKKQYSKTQYLRQSIMSNSSYFNQKAGKQ